MITIISLWLPILLSAVIVFILSSIIHTVLGYHANDFAKIPREDEVVDALRPFSIPPGEYHMPAAGSMKEMGTPEFIDKMTKGPMAFITVLENGPPKMGKQLTGSRCLRSLSFLLQFGNILIFPYHLARPAVHGR